ncbi:A24 family peptidase [Methylomonas sp. OY6]|uniref:Prepilin leader peptidase/N-methyltransferase n=1 Tax=Methylomonas defluvii TaxID=3045149 RepID=A0ABU4U8N3_9GAMM|nr:A24 family peptidase [Methylomonas sp. OY6]MDX8125782.1 A24 family peptidase [Methylomonas sp. OY6]
MVFATLQQYPLFMISVVCVLGLLVGSFLNVVIYRLPVMMQAGWRRECREYLQLPHDEASEVFNLMLPASHCPSCKTEIKAYQNIPVISYLLLGGKCAHCGVKIAIRYPLIEAFTGLCSAVVAWHFGYGWALAFALLLTWCLIALSFIDIDQQLLPDSITLPMLWLGLLLSLFDIYTNSHDAIIGAVAGYLSLWSVYQLFKLLTGKEGMGYGDFKLLALFGAWLGWQYLPLIILLSSLVGAVIGIAMIVFGKRDAGKPIPFGPYLAMAGWLAMLFGPELNALYLHTAGL